MTNKERFYPEALFGGFTDIDGTIVFFSRVQSLLDASSVVLDVGCGRGEYQEDPVPLRRELRNFKGKVAQVIGLDVDPVAQGNPFLDEFRRIQGDSWPVQSDSVDLIVCDNVLEHIPNPDQFFSEIHRVLKDGGYLCVRTPNRWSYIALAATIIPNKHHCKVTSFVQQSRKAEDVFPTVYRCNSIRKLKNIMRKNELECVVYGYEAEPSYLSFSRVAYWLGVLHQRYAPRFMRPAIFAFGKMKKSNA